MADAGGRGRLVCLCADRQCVRSRADRSHSVPADGGAGTPGGPHRRPPCAPLRRRDGLCDRGHGERRAGADGALWRRQHRCGLPGYCVLWRGARVRAAVDAVMAADAGGGAGVSARRRGQLARFADGGHSGAGDRRRALSHRPVRAVPVRRGAAMRGARRGPVPAASAPRRLPVGIVERGAGRRPLHRRQRGRSSA